MPLAGWSAQRLQRSLHPTPHTPTEMAAAGAGSSLVASATKAFRLVSYNVDGLCERITVKRAMAVTHLLVALDPFPAVICLQEVVPATVSIFQLFADAHDMHMLTGSSVSMGNPYFCALLVKRDSSHTLVKTTAAPFPTSKMGRHYLTAQMRIGGMPMSFTTSHLESLKDHASERKNQLKQMLSQLTAGDDALKVFVGDLNLRDSEVGMLPPGVVDAWVSSGEPAAAKWTWDLALNKNVVLPGGAAVRCRFDRAFVLSRPIAVAPTTLVDLSVDEDEPTALPVASPPVTWKVAGFSLLGTEATCKDTGGALLHPSDHFGLVIDFAAS